MKPYERLSQVYNTGWGDFAKQYVDFIDQLLKERTLTHARILDVACGTGILAIELAQLNHSVHGMDISPEMINLAKAKSAGLPDLSFSVQDMTRLNVDEQFNLVTCTFDSINYILNLNDVQELNGQPFIQHYYYDSTRNESIITFSFSDGTYEIHKQRPYDYDELKPLLNRAGLSVINLFSWFHKIPYSSRTPKLFCIAEKHSTAANNSVSQAF